MSRIPRRELEVLKMIYAEDINALAFSFSLDCMCRSYTFDKKYVCELSTEVPQF